MSACEYQLGKRGLYPSVGGTLNQPIHVENKEGYYARNFNFDLKIKVNGKHLEAFHWLMHLADGQNSNFDIASKSGIDIVTINEAISLFKNSNLIEIK
jgi:aminopeptidase-like protein